MMTHHHRSVPHDGVSLDGDCMTYSIGFRAPAQKELLAATAAAAQALMEGDGCVCWIDRLFCRAGRVQIYTFTHTISNPHTHIPTLPHTYIYNKHTRTRRAFYTDPGLSPPPNGDAGEISAPALQDIKRLILDALNPILEDDARFTHWLGQHLTAPRRPRLGEEEYPPKPLWALGGPVVEEEGGIEGFPALLSDWGSAREVVAEIRWVLGGRREAGLSWAGRGWAVLVGCVCGPYPPKTCLRAPNLYI
jgi:hypothetical protein